MEWARLEWNGYGGFIQPIPTSSGLRHIDWLLVKNEIASIIWKKGKSRLPPHYIEVSQDSSRPFDCRLDRSYTCIKTSIAQGFWYLKVAISLFWFDREVICKLRKVQGGKFFKPSETSSGSTQCWNHWEPNFINHL